MQLLIEAILLGFIVTVGGSGVCTHAYARVSMGMEWMRMPSDWAPMHTASLS